MGITFTQVARSRSPKVRPVCKAPRHGEHTVAVLHDELGIPGEEVERLAAKGAIAGTAPVAVAAARPAGSGPGASSKL